MVTKEDLRKAATGSLEHNRQLAQRGRVAIRTGIAAKGSSA
jgi:hypothetical protein